MKNSIILIISIVVLLFCKSEAQNCIVSAAFTTPTEVMVTSGENCAEFYFGPMIEKTDIVLAITETSIDCSKNKIIVYDEARNEIFDYCKAKEATRIKSKNATMTLKYFGSNIVVSLVSTTGDYLSCYLHFNKFDLIEDEETEEELTTTTETTTTMMTTTTPTTTTSTTTTTTTTITTTSTTTPMTTTTRAATTTTTIMITTTTTSTTITSTTRFTTETTTKFGLFPNGGTSQINCGVPFFKPFGNELRIVGGIVSAANSWPWQVMITNDLYMCGASLINNQWILTAAHCVFNGYIKAYLGAHSKGFARTQKYYRISKIYKHERYDKNLIKNDIALMKLDTPVVFNEKIRPICLPTVFTATPTKHAIVTGWGLTQANMNGPTSDLLRQVTVPIRPSNRCQGFVLDRTQICAGDPDLLNPKDSCQGDSGGPLFIKEGNKYVLVGITSFGGPVCNGFGVYTNVYEFKDWIIQTMAKH